MPFSRSKTSGLSLIANKNENSRQANIAGYGRHFPTIMAASAMYPLPADISFTKKARCAVERYAPDIPPSMPLKSKA